MALPCSNKSMGKLKSIPNEPNAQVLLLATTQANGTALANSAASAAIVESVHPLEWHQVVVDGTVERNAFVREVLSQIHLRQPSNDFFFHHSSHGSSR
jgi:hypothetical protein